MPLPVYRLRRVLAVTAALFIAVISGMLIYARMRIRDVRKEVPNKLGIEIKQTANGFQFSKSDGKRTLFTVQARDVKEFKLNGRAELHNVNIVLYGRDSSRFDQIYGDNFAYDPKTGDVTAKGEVQIDLVANPAGLASPDQTTPKELKNPIHLKTRDLVFNRETGNAWTDALVEFRTPQAAGSALGVRYNGKTNALTLASKIHLELSAPNEAVIDAEHGSVTNDPREIVLEHPHLVRDSGTMIADRAVFRLNDDNHVASVLATGNVSTETRTASKSSTPASIDGRADEAEFSLDGTRDELRKAVLTGNVRLDQTGDQPMQGQAGRVTLEFSGQNQLQKVHAEDGAHLTQKAAPPKPGSTAPLQDFDLTAPVIDLALERGHVLKNATTSGAAQITILSFPQNALDAAHSQRTVVTADRFEAKFVLADGHNRLSTVHGSPNARIVNSAPGEPERVSTSDSVDAAFLPQGGIESVMQQGSVTYSDDDTPEKRVQASANSARYTPADQLLVLTGGPRIASGGMATTAKTIRVNRGTGDAIAEGDVKSTYSDLKEQPNGALLASSSPIHVTARTMTAHNTPGVALYTGNARLWQDANIIEAPSIQFDRNHRSVVAEGSAAQPVQTMLVQTEKPRVAPSQEKSLAQKNPDTKSRRLKVPNASSSLGITSAKLTYTDSERKIHYEGAVQAKTTDFTASAKTVDAYLLPRSQALLGQTASGQTGSGQPASGQSTGAQTSGTFAGPGQLDHMVAEGDVLIQEEDPERRAEGQKLVYTASDDRFVLTGGPPSIFDAEQGKITGVSLTFFRRDDRVLVEGEASSPVVTTTRVAR